MAALARARPDRRGHPGVARIRSAAVSSRLPGFFRLSLAERRRRVAEVASLDDVSLAALAGGLDEHDADHMIENVIGRLALPLAIATNFTIDGVDALVPMA